MLLELCLCVVIFKTFFYRVSNRVTNFGIFDAGTLAFFWYVLFQSHPSLEGNNKFVNSQIFGSVIIFGKCGI